MGLPSDNIITWNKNGIEFYYPGSAIKEIFVSDGQIEINGDKVRLNGIEYTKIELARNVIPRLNEHTEYNDEFCDKLLSKLDVVLS